MQVAMGCIDEIEPCLTVIINQSMQSGVLSNVWVEAFGIPTLRILDLTLPLKNIFHVSNLQQQRISLSYIWLRIISFNRFS